MRCGSQQAVPWDIMSYATPDARDLARTYSLQTTLQEGALTMASGGVWFAWTFGGGDVPVSGIETTRIMAQFAKDRAPALGQSRSLSDVAVLDCETSWRKAGNYQPSQEATDAARCLQEADYLTDIVSEDTLRRRLAPYRVVVVPGQAYLAPETVAELQRFAADGGLVVLTGPSLSGEADGGAGFTGATRTGEAPAGPGKLPLRGTDFYVAQRTALQATGAEVALSYADGQAAVTRWRVGKGAVATFSARRLTYPDDGLLGTVLRELGAGPSYTTSAGGDAPVVCSLRAKDGQTVLHVTDLTRRVSGMAVDVNTTQYTDLNPALHGLTVSLPMAQAPTAVKAYPPLTRVSHSYADGVLKLTIGRMQAHVAIVIDGGAVSSTGMPADAPTRVARFHPEDTAGGILFSDGFERLAVGQTPAAPWAPENRFGTSITATDETTAGTGRRSLKLVEKPGSSFWPFLHRSITPFRNGRARLSFDLRVESGGPCLVELRYEGKGPGPSLRFGDDGKVTQGSRELASFTPGEWFHADVVVQLGGPSPAYELTVTQPGREPQQTKDIPYATEWFYRCDSVYFVGSGQSEGAFYLDNVEMERYPVGE